MSAWCRSVPIPWTPSGSSRPSPHSPEWLLASSSRTDPSGWWSASAQGRCSASGSRPPSDPPGSCPPKHWASAHLWATFSANIDPSFCCSLILCSPAALGGEGRRRTVARVQSTSTLFSSINYLQVQSILFNPLKVQSFQSIQTQISDQSSSAAGAGRGGMPLAMRASNSTSRRRWVSKTWKQIILGFVYQIVLFTDFKLKCWQCLKFVNCYTVIRLQSLF